MEKELLIPEMNAALAPLIPFLMVLSDNATPCAICGFILGAHSHDGLHCPNPSDFGPLFAETVFAWSHAR
jgi:hypothetical protein